MKAGTATKKKRSVFGTAENGHMRFEAVKLDPLFEVLDAVAWIGAATCKQVAQFAGIDPRTAGKLVKNGVSLGVLDALNGSTYRLTIAYPYKGSIDQKQAVVREALLRMPLLKSVRQFLRLGEGTDIALRKAATVAGVENYNANALAPLLHWAQQLNALEPDVDVEDLVDQAAEAKKERHTQNAAKRVVFVSHSSKDKPFIRKLVADLTAGGISVWLDEQRILVGDSIPERIGQGLAESDVFIIALSENSVSSEWVKRELDSALVGELSKRNIRILPMKLSECEIPEIIRNKKYADFTTSYKSGFDELLRAIKGLEA